MQLLLLLFFSHNSIGQELTQTIRGTIIDLDNQGPLTGATVQLLDLEPLQGTTTDANGDYMLLDVPAGRQTIQFSYLGYETRIIPNVVVSSGKEVILKVALEEAAIVADEIVVRAFKEKGKAINDLALLSARSISAEETNRYAGGFSDPSRILSNFAGVTTTHDGGNDIIVRGNSPKYVQWRLEGMQITNPNHFGDQSGVGGSISTLNNNVLATSDFYSGAFSAEYGAVLSGVYDLKLRSGNNEKFESVFGFGLLGTDFTFEGPLSKNSGASFIANYRYSTAAIINELGLLGDISGVPKFQDGVFKVLVPTKKLGTLSLFGLAGKSELLFKDVTPGDWELPGTPGPNKREDFNKAAHLLNLGLNHTLSLGDNSYLKTSLSYSNEKIEDEVIEKEVLPFYDDQAVFLRDSIIDSRSNYQGALQKNNLRAAISYNHKLSATHKFQLGAKYVRSVQDNAQSQLTPYQEREYLVDFDEGIGTVRNYLNWKYKPTNDLTMVVGIHNMNVLYNNKNTFEPRVAVNWRLTAKGAVNIGFGQHSTMESIHNYFTQIEDSNGQLQRPNQDLGLLKARHFVAGYEHRLSSNLRAKLELYYQDLYNLPVENDPSSLYSTINEGLEFNYVDLVNEGKGKNYGVEFTLERFFHRGFYYMLNASVYESKYTALDGVERNTRYNGNYLINCLAGKEFESLGKKNNQTLTLNLKAFLGGGKRITPLLRNAAGEIAVDPAKDQFWDYSKAYETTLQDLHLIVIAISYKWNRAKATHELILNLDNVTNSRGKISEYYDERAPNNIGYVKQVGIFPNLMYRVYF